MNYKLKKFILKTKSECIQMGVAVKITETPRKTMVLLSNNDSNRVVLVSYQSNVLGEPCMYAYLVNPKKYEWARHEGFSLDQMLELEAEKVFVEIDSSKIPQYLL